MVIDELRKMAQQKKQELIEQHKNLDKSNATLEFLEDDDCFFQIKGNLAIPVLMYIGVPESKLRRVYFGLIGFDSWLNT